LHKNLVDLTKILLPPLQIKLDIMKRFVKALPKTGNCLKYLCQKFSHLLEAKLEKGIFIGPDIKELMFDEDFLLMMTEVEREAWMAFKSVVTEFLGNNKDLDFVTVVANMLEKLKVLGCLMRLKINFLNLHLDFFPKNINTVSEEQGNTSAKTLRNGKKIPGSVKC
jgi:hypothetical protein